MSVGGQVGPQAGGLGAGLRRVGWGDFRRQRGRRACSLRKTESLLPGCRFHWISGQAGVQAAGERGEPGRSMVI